MAYVDEQGWLRSGARGGRMQTTSGPPTHIVVMPQPTIPLRNPNADDDDGYHPLGISASFW